MVQNIENVGNEAAHQTRHRDIRDAFVKIDDDDMEMSRRNSATAATKSLDDSERGIDRQDSQDDTKVEVKGIGTDNDAIPRSRKFW